jgi:hypothetical protein
MVSKLKGGQCGAKSNSGSQEDHCRGNLDPRQGKAETHPDGGASNRHAGRGQRPLRVAHARRNRDLDPQLVWRGKDEQDWSDLVLHAPPLYIQEKVHPNRH